MHAACGCAVGACAHGFSAFASVAVEDVIVVASVVRVALGAHDAAVDSAVAAGLGGTIGTCAYILHALAVAADAETLVAAGTLDCTVGCARIAGAGAAIGT